MSISSTQGISNRHAAVRFKKHVFELLWYFDIEEPIRGVSVVFAALVDDAEIAVPLRLLIGNHAVELADLQGDS